MKQIRILWIDDEIDLLKIHIHFLEKKGYSVDTANNGIDAIEMTKEQDFDIIFLDENMPGLTGLETLGQLKNINPNIPIVMITKSEEEDIMEQAIGSQINDYLIKPVNPNQILLSIKKNVDTQRLVTQKTTSAYQSEFTKLGMEINDSYSYEDWVEVYKKLVYWELELEKSDDNTMDEVLKMQKSEANNAFSKFIKKNYKSWFGNNTDERPLMSPSLLRNKVFPHIENGEQVYVLVIDNLRYDQWRIMMPQIQELFKIEEESLYCSILPTATQYARNSIFAGLMPLEIDKLLPSMWLNDEEIGGKNMYEEELLEKQLKRLGMNIKYSYEKVNNLASGNKLLENLHSLKSTPLNVVVFNFIDMLSHSRTEMNMIRELASDEPAYRSLTLSWFNHSPLLELFKELASQKCKVFVTTDHGTIKVNNPVKVVGDRNTTTNLRYKQGKNLNYKAKEVFEITDPKEVHLPSTNVSSRYIFSLNDDFFAYPNNFHYYVKYYKDTFQHGGISLEEMLIPAITLSPK